VIRLGELVMILDLHRQGLSVSAIARQLERDRKTVRKYIERGLTAPAYGPRQPRLTVVTPFAPYLRERIATFPELTGSRLLREIKELGYAGGYTAVKDFLRTIRPRALQAFERRFETPPGKQAQVDFAFFRTVFTDQPDAERIVWLFSMVLGHSRMMWGRFVAHQDLQTVLRCHIAAFWARSTTRPLSTIANCSTWPRTTAFCRKRARPTGQRQRARSSARSATSGKTSFSAARSATSMI
jgi:transposase